MKVRELAALLEAEASQLERLERTDHAAALRQLVAVLGKLKPDQFVSTALKRQS